MPLGVLPLGTLNHFAGDLKIPADLEAAVRLIAEGEVHRLDVGEVNGEIFLNNSSLGFYPPIVQARDQEMKRFKRGKWLAMAIATFRLLPKLSSLHVKISSGDWQVERKTELLFVGNNEYGFSAFAHGAPDRLEESGNLYLYLARSRSRLSLFGLALVGLVRDIKQTRSVEDWRLPEFKVEVREKHSIPVAFDGEVSKMRSPLLYRTRPRGAAGDHSSPGAPLRSPQLLGEIAHGAVEHLVLPLADPLDRRRHRDVRHQADPLQLAAVGVAHVVAAEADRGDPRQREVGDVAVGSRRLRADELRAVRRLEEEAGVLGLADRPLVDQHHGAAGVGRPHRVGGERLE